MKHKTKTEEELPNFPFPLILDNSHLMDYNLAQKLPLELFLRHQGHKMTIDETNYALSISDSPRDTLIVKISSFRGVSSGAVHYYGTINLPRVHFIECETGDTHFGARIPVLLCDVELHRPLTARELSQNRDRWEGYRVGDVVPGFDTIEDVVKRAEEVRDRNFPGFKLKTS